jgi:ribosomal protein L3 glutamine methyltransferase
MFNQAKSHLSTVGDLLRFAVSRFNQANLFFGHGTTNAYDEAAYLILHTLHLPLDRLEPFLDARLLPEEVDAVVEILRRRVEDRLPAAYLTHEAWLGDLRFYVDERVIVPRSFIAELLREQLQPGSGCLATLMALTFPNAQIDAVDVSIDALDVARRNVADYGLEGQLSLIQSDLFTALKGRRYDLIVSNPPYVNAPSMQTLPEEYRREPVGALASGEDGLEHVRTILREAPKHLNKGGLLVVEIGHNRDALEEAFPELPFTWLETSAGDEHVFLLTREQMA